VGTVVVYVHGLWQSGGEALWLRRRLAQDLGAEAVAFSYPSVAANVTANALALAKYLSAVRADTLHLIGHSLGGLVILKLFEQSPEMQAALPPGRIVLLGSPLRGSRTARNLARLPFGRRIMGRSIHEEVLMARDRQWNRSRELGVIAGDLGFGLGRLVGTLGGPSDGTVLIEETQLEGAADRVVLRVSHTGMLFSAAVARAAAGFLRTGRFSR
jgi:pimeloyl-ACP methyl ester carboxylesterase